MMRTRGAAFLMETPSHDCWRATAWDVLRSVSSSSNVELLAQIHGGTPSNSVLLHCDIIPKLRDPLPGLDPVFFGTATQDAFAVEEPHKLSLTERGNHFAFVPEPGEKRFVFHANIVSGIV